MRVEVAPWNRVARYCTIHAISLIKSPHQESESWILASTLGRGSETVCNVIEVQFSPKKFYGACRILRNIIVQFCTVYGKRKHTVDANVAERYIRGVSNFGGLFQIIIIMNLVQIRSRQ